MPSVAPLPRWLKLVYTLWLAVWIPVYWIYNGPQNFLWLCDTANFAILAGLWLESSLLLSAQAVGVLGIQLAWAADFLTALLTGFHPIGGTEYMFDPTTPLWLRAFSLFHLAIPPLLVGCLARVGYDHRGWRLQTLFTWILWPLTWLLTDPALNVNWLQAPFGIPQTWVPTPVFVLFGMVAVPLLVYLPSHWLLGRIFWRRDD